MQDEIINPFSNFNGATVEVWGCHYIIYWVCDNLSMLVLELIPVGKKGPVDTWTKWTPFFRRHFQAPAYAIAMFVLTGCEAVWIPDDTDRWDYSDDIMSAMASLIIVVWIVCPTFLFKRRSKKTSTLRVTGLCEGNSPMTGEFPTQRASNAKNISIWWCRRWW